MLYDAARHARLVDIGWRPGRVRDAVAAIAREIEAAFDPDRLWPLDPADFEPGTPPVVHGLYLGAAGIVHALARLAEAGLYEPRLDLAGIAARLHEPALRMPDEEGAGASLLLGSSGILAVTYRLAPSAATADALAAAIAGNVAHPSNELLLGAPGTMLVARAMHARTGEERFADLWRASARTLLARQDAQGLWTQDLYGERLRHVGAGHGFAGNIHALLSAPQWLEDAGRAVVGRTVATVRALAIREGPLANWPALADPGDELPPRVQCCDALGPARPPVTGAGDEPPPRVQWCHGAPGVVIALARVAPGDGELTALLRAGGELTWRAGPSALNAGLCHGTAGNGFAFLALHERTGDELWLARARAFAAHAIEQSAGRGRWSLYTGEPGIALLAAASLTGDARFPGLDDL